MWLEMKRKCFFIWQFEWKQTKQEPFVSARYRLMCQDRPFRKQMDFYFDTFSVLFAPLILPRPISFPLVLFIREEKLHENDD